MPNAHTFTTLLPSLLVILILFTAVGVAVWLIVRAVRHPAKCAGCKKCPLADNCQTKTIYTHAQK